MKHDGRMVGDVATRSAPGRAPGTGHAVVIGAGIAGICAARVLAETYDHVTLLDRDALPDGDEPRRGVPQGQHVHAVLMLAKAVISELFPGLLEGLVAAGVPTGDLLAHTRAYYGEDRLVSITTGLEAVYISRPNLESALRGWLSGLRNVTVRPGVSAVGLIASPDGQSIAGVRTVSGDGQESEDIHGDLVADCAGRGSRVPAWLAELGLGEPPEQRVRIDLSYSSCLFSMPDGVLEGAHLVALGPRPQNPRGAYLLDVGNGRWLVSLIGYRDTPPPVDLDGFRQFARQLPVPDVDLALGRATPVGRPVRFRMAEAVRRRYHLMKRCPDGLIVLGDAASTYNPTYGQGMSVAAQQALMLRNHLQEHGPTRLPQLRAKIARVSDVAWTMSVNYDLRMPWILGRRTVSIRLGNAYMALVNQAATTDERVAVALARVANLLDSPAAIAHPSVAFRVLVVSPLRRWRKRSTSAAQSIARHPPLPTHVPERERTPQDNDL
jgi:2-polyprenyl-6-methoxyphenol hydroxylase-like FAD-dependent oxidoreductase